MLRRKQPLQPLSPVIELHVLHPPAGSVGEGELDAEGAAFRYGNRNGQGARRTATASRQSFLAQDFGFVGLHPVSVETPFQPSAAPGYDVAGIQVPVQGILPFCAAHRAVGGRQFQESGFTVMDDSVGEQLGGKVEIVVGRSGGRPVTGYIGIGFAAARGQGQKQESSDQASHHLLIFRL